MMTTSERVQTIQEAQDKLREAIELVEQATKGTAIEQRTRYTLIAGLQMAIDKDHEWLGQATSLQDLIGELEEEEEDEMDD